MRLKVLISVLAVSAALWPPARAGGAPQMVYMSARAGNAALYLMYGPDSVKLNAADSPGHDCGPALQPRHLPGAEQLVAFESNRVTEPYLPNNFEVYTVGLATGTVKRLTNNPGWDGFPTWSPDGTTMAFSREDPRFVTSIWTMDPNGSSLQQLTHASMTQSHDYPAWSPDGSRIAYVVAGPAATAPAVWVMNADGSSGHKIAEGEFPAWSPDSKRIVFSSRRGGPPQDSDIYVVNADGTGERLLEHLAGAEFMPSWSSDGRHIAYVSDADGWFGLSLVNVLPTGDGVDVYGSGPAPAQIWEVDLDAGGRVTARRRLSNGDVDLFPRYEPA